MRTTLTLDPDVMELVREEMARSRLPFKQVVNQTLRLGLKARHAGRPRERFVVKPHDFGPLKPGIDPDRLNQLAGDLEDEGMLARLRRDEHP